VRPLADIERRLGEIEAGAAGHGMAAAAELLALGEDVLEHWVTAKGAEPTRETREGFRLLALHRQGCADDPSFNACRETCRELVYHYNLVTGDPQHEAAAQRLLMMTMVANHLFLFVAGKMQVAELGDFCCASRPLRQDAAPLESA
jgi:hypothetical protein